MFSTLFQIALKYEHLGKVHHGTLGTTHPSTETLKGRGRAQYLDASFFPLKGTYPLHCLLGLLFYIYGNGTYLEKIFLPMMPNCNKDNIAKIKLHNSL